MDCWHGFGVLGWIFPLLGLGMMVLCFLGMLGRGFGWWGCRPHAGYWRWEERPRRAPSSDEVAELREEIRALREEITSLKA